MRFKRLPVAVMAVALLLQSALAAGPATKAASVLVIVKAEWGREKSWMDVTDKVKANLANGRLEMNADVRILGDPARGAPKTLRITYTLNGVEKTTEFAENDSVALGINTGPGDAMLGADKVLRIVLDEPFAEYHPADGGRALVFYLAKAHLIVVYETATGKLKGTIKVSSNDIRITANKDTIFVALADQGMIQPYALATLEKGRAFPIPDKHVLKDFAAGSTSTGPLYVNTGEKLVAVTANGAPLTLKGNLPGDCVFRVSSDGSSLVAWGGDQHFLAVHLKDNTVTTVNSVEASAMGNRRYMVSADGGFYFYEGRIYDALTRPLPTVKPYTNMIPSTDPRYFIAVKGLGFGTHEIAICSAGDRKVLAELPDVGNLGGWTAGGDVPRVATVNDAAAGNGEPRVVFLPEEKVIATIVENNKEVLIRPFDLMAALNASDYLFVDSNPALEVTPGKTFAYQPHVVSKRGGLKYELQSGPAGMSVAADGKMSWSVPAGFKDSASVIVAVSDASGQTAYHSFTLGAVAAPQPVAVAPPGRPSPAGPVIVPGSGGAGVIPKRTVVTDDGTRVIGGVQTISVVREAPTGESAKGDAPKIKPMSEVRGMVVSRGADGNYHGSVIDIIATVQQNPNQTITLRGQIGREMRVSIDEAMRLVHLKHPEFARASLDMSFGDKYSSKDGGSAGTAFTLLMLAALGDFELNPDAAITGDITVDSKVRQVGEVPAKAHGAALDKTKVVAIPESNASEFDDALLLSGPAIMWETQIFTVRNLDEAIAVMRKDPDVKLSMAMALFDKLKADFAGKAPALLAQPANSQTLVKILELAPNHLSAKNLQLLAAGKGPKTLSAIATVREAMRAINPIRTALEDDSPHPEVTQNGSLAKARAGLDKLQGIADKAALPVITALNDLCTAYSIWSITVADKKTLPAEKVRVTKVLSQKADAVDAAMGAVFTDKEVIDKLMHD